MHPFRRIALAAGLLVLASTPTAQAAEIQEIGWRDLMPAAEPLANPLQNLDIRLRFDIAYAAQVRDDIERGTIRADGPEARNAEQTITQLATQIAAQGIDAEALIAEYAKFNTEMQRRQGGMVETLAGARVSLPGYALPLDVTPDGVREFLLVPYVGACIHVPPPPPNQMVFVAADEPVAIDGLFQAVQVTGLLRIEPASRSLSFVDGSADIATGYVLEEVSIVAFDE